MGESRLIRTEAKPACVCCGGDGFPLYSNIEDKLFGVSGGWVIKRCASVNCGLLWLDPTPIKDDIYLAYQNYYTHISAPQAKLSLLARVTNAYQAYYFAYRPQAVSPLLKWIGIFLSVIPFFREHMDYPFAYLKNIKRGKLLELGVGSGETLKRFIDWGWDAKGLDFDPQAVKACAEIGLNVSEGDLFSQKFANESFDAVFSSHVLEHVPDPLALMIEGVRVLKEGGVFVAVTPNGNSALHGLFKSHWRGLEPPRHLNIFTFNALLSAAEKAGFSRVDVMTSNFSAAGVFYYSAYLSGIKKTFLLRLISNLVRFILTCIKLIFKKSGEELVLVAYK